MNEIAQCTRVHIQYRDLSLCTLTMDVCACVFHIHHVSIEYSWTIQFHYIRTVLVENYNHVSGNRKLGKPLAQWATILGTQNRGKTEVHNEKM